MIKIKAGNERNSRAIAKFANAEIGYFGLKLIVHVLIRGSLGYFPDVSSGCGDERPDSYGLLVLVA